MACSCRTTALRIFARSLAQVHGPTTQYARSTWPANSPRLPNRNISVAPNYRQNHTLAESSNTAEEDAEPPKVLPEDQRKPQPEGNLPSSSSPSGMAGEEDKLFTIKKRSKNAARKAARYSQQSDASLSSQSQGHPEEQPDKDQQLRTSAEEPKTSAEEPKAIAEEPKVSAEESTEQPKKTKKLREKKRQDRAEKRAQRVEQEAAKAKDKEEREDNRPEWLKQKQTLKKKFPEGWRPPKRLSPDALDGIRVLHQQFPDMYTTAALAKKFEVSPEAIRRILRAKWEPTAEEDESRQKRWFNRGVSVWQRYAELGMQPPRRWREAGVQAGPWGPAHKERQAEKEDVAGDADPETTTRIQAQMNLSKSLI